MCAERVAVFKAVSEGNVDIEEIAVVASTGKPIYPCGACRQVLFEFNPKTKIHLSDEKILTLFEILPLHFRRMYLDKFGGIPLIIDNTLV